MRILFTFIGGVGHFHPLVPVARAATEAGHEVAVACSGGLVSQVEALGFTALATSEPRTLAREPLRDMTPLAAVDLRAAEEEFAENFATKGARRHAAAVQEHLRGWGPDVVVRDEADRYGDRGRGARRTPRDRAGPGSGDAGETGARLTALGCSPG